MNRLTAIGISAVTLAATVAGTLGLATSASAAASRTAVAPRPAAAAACTIARRNYAFPRGAETFRTLTAGSVTIAPVNRGTIKVLRTQAAAGWHAYVDSGSGSSVDVYFRSGRHLVKFEAEINDWGGLTVTLSNCG